MEPLSLRFEGLDVLKASKKDYYHYYYIEYGCKSKKGSAEKSPNELNITQY